MAPGDGTKTTKSTKPATSSAKKDPTRATTAEAAEAEATKKPETLEQFHARRDALKAQLYSAQ